MNGYVAIIGMFIVSGLAITAWGVRIMAQARKTQRWPSVDGEIVHSVAGAETEDLLPDIEFSYRVGSGEFSQKMVFPSGTMPSPEFNKSYLKKYPVGAQVRVYYDPGQHNMATLEPGTANGDWMVLAAGLVVTLTGVGMLLAEL